MLSITKKLKSTLLICFIGLLSHSSLSQAPAMDALPEYLIITTENTKLLGGIGLSIDWKKSLYKSDLIQLYDYLSEAKQNRVRTQIDLLNAMSVLGFEYVNAFNSNAGTIGGNTDIGGSSELGLSSSKFRVNMVFRKKEKFRTE